MLWNLVNAFPFATDVHKHVVRLFLRTARSMSLPTEAPITQSLSHRYGTLWSFVLQYSIKLGWWKPGVEQGSAGRLKAANCTGSRKNNAKLILVKMLLEAISCQWIIIIIIMFVAETKTNSGAFNLPANYHNNNYVRCRNQNKFRRFLTNKVEAFSLQTTDLTQRCNYYSISVLPRPTCFVKLNAEKRPLS